MATTTMASAAAAALREAAIARHGAAEAVRSPYFATRHVWADDIATCGAIAAAGSLARVYYLDGCVPRADIARYLTDTPAVAVSGDRHIALQDGSHTGSPGWQLPGLITFEERRRSRKKAILSWEKAYAAGGYRCKLDVFATPRWGVAVGIAGPQFEVRYLEASDFIVEPPGDGEVLRADGSTGGNGVSEAAGLGRADLFPHYYPVHPDLPFSGRKPTWAEADAFVKAAAVPAELRSEVDIVPIPHTEPDDEHGRPTYLYGGAYRRCVAEDAWLALSAFEAFLADHGSIGASGGAAPPHPQLPTPRGWLQFGMVGMGFFAEWLGRRNISDLLLPRFVGSIRWALEQGPPPPPTAEAASASAADATARRPWRHLATLEMCDFSSRGTFHLGDPSSLVNGVHVVHGLRRGLLDAVAMDAANAAAAADAATAPYTLGFVNAGDAFAWVGNEHGYCSVEAMLGENTSMRRGQVYLYNPWLLDDRAHVPLRSPLMAAVAPPAASASGGAGASAAGGGST